MFLPDVKGRFPVGVTTFATPVRPSRAIGSVKLRSTSNTSQDQLDHALILEEVAFTAYYPAEVEHSSEKGIPWFIRPVSKSLRGFSAFLGIPKWLLWPVVYLFGSLLKIPAYPNAPLLSPEATKASEASEVTSLSQWPLVIFSHGLGGSRTAYSQFCSQLAASGKVVLALEHRDGTGVVCMPRSWKQEGKSKTRTLLYLQERDIRWDDNDTDNINPLPLRAQQLAFRREEVYIAYSAFSRFIRGDPTLEFDTIDGAVYDKKSWTSQDGHGQEKVKLDSQITFTGHSFGGCTVLSLLSTKPSEGHSPLPVEKTIILDPWLEPFPSPGPVPLDYTTADHVLEATEGSVAPSSEATTLSPPDQDGHVQNKSDHPRMLVINSETFTLWKDHYARLIEIIAGWKPQGGRIITLVGSVHVSFSDFSVLPVIRKKTAQPILETITTLSLAFLNGELDKTLQGLPTKSMEVEVIGVKKDGKPKRRLVGNPGDVIAH